MARCRYNSQCYAKTLELHQHNAVADQAYLTLQYHRPFSSRTNSTYTGGGRSIPRRAEYFDGVAPFVPASEPDGFSIPPVMPLLWSGFGTRFCWLWVWWWCSGCWCPGCCCCRRSWCCSCITFTVDEPAMVTGCCGTAKVVVPVDEADVVDVPVVLEDVAAGPVAVADNCPAALGTGGDVKHTKGFPPVWIRMWDFK
eukprot:scpid69776/ scgid32779/ 